MYSQHFLRPVSAKSFTPSSGEILPDLGASASPKLVRWLCAILSPLPGWTADGGGVSPWAAFCSGHVRFVVAVADRPASFPSPGELPPNSAEATELLIQFCAMYGHVSRELIEPDLWPWLDRGHVREYVHWVWWGKRSVQDVQLGFRKDTGRFVPDVPDDLGTLRGRGRISTNEVIEARAIAGLDHSYAEFLHARCQRRS